MDEVFFLIPVTDSEPLAFEMSQEQADELRQIAAARDQSPEELLGHWLESHLENQDEEAQLQSRSARAGLTVSEYLKRSVQQLLQAD